MKFMFVDDSSQRGSREGMGALVAAGCVIVDETKLRQIGEAVDGLCRAAGVPNGTELKWSPPRDNWIRDNLLGADRNNLYRSCIDALGLHGGRAAVVVWDTGRTTLQGGEAFGKALQWALERFVMQLSGEELGAVVADRPGGGRAEEELLLTHGLEVIERGTPYVALSERIALNLLTTPSHLSRHVQLADLVAGSTAAMVGGSLFAPPVFERVRPLLVQNWLGARSGVGLKLFPHGLVNLYFHLLGERTYERESGEVIALPSASHPYTVI